MGNLNNKKEVKKEVKQITLEEKEALKQQIIGQFKEKFEKMDITKEQKEQALEQVSQRIDQMYEEGKDLSTNFKMQINFKKPKEKTKEECIKEELLQELSDQLNAYDEISEETKKQAMEQASKKIDEILAKQTDVKGKLVFKIPTKEQLQDPNNKFEVEVQLLEEKPVVEEVIQETVIEEKPVYEYDVEEDYTFHVDENTTPEQLQNEMVKLVKSQIYPIIKIRIENALKEAKEQQKVLEDIITDSIKINEYEIVDSKKKR